MANATDDFLCPENLPTLNERIKDSDQLYWVDLFFLHPTVIINQESGKTVLLDSQTLEPVPYASVGSGSFSIFTDSNGYFSLDGFLGETVSIERMGYKRLSIAADKIGDTLFLKPALFLLEPVEVSSKRTVHEAGFHRMKTYGKTIGKLSGGVGVVCDDLPAYATITKVYAHLRQNKKGLVYRVSLFSVSDSSLPDQLLYSQEYVSPNGKNMLSVPIEHVTIPNKEDITVIFYCVDQTKEAMDFDVYASLRMTKENIGVKSFVFYRISNQWYEVDFRPEMGHDWNFKLGLEYEAN